MDRQSCVEGTGTFAKTPNVIVEKKEEMGHKGSEPGAEDLSEDVQELFRCGDDGTVEVHTRVSDINGTASKAWRMCAKKVGWRMRICQHGRRRRSGRFGKRCLRTPKQGVRFQKASCGEAQIFWDTW